MFNLSDEHCRMLREESGISDACIEARGYRTVTDARELAALGFAPKQQLTPTLLIPGHGPDGSNRFYTHRPDYPRQSRNSKGELTDGFIKYEMPKGASMRLDVPPVCRPALANPSIPAWITEGIKKADSLASHDFCAVCLYGVWTFKGRNEFGGTTVLADFDFIAWDNRDVRIVFDSDVMNKPEVRKALERLTEILQRKGAHVSAVYLPGGRDNKVGVDDFLRHHTKEELEALVDAPRPQAQAAPADFELLDAPPPALCRPLGIIEGRAYAATWPHVRKTIRESVDKSGNIIRHNPPKVSTEQRLIIIREDGLTFGEGGRSTLEDLGFEVNLPEIPPNGKLWQSKAIRDFVQQQRPEPTDVFNRIVDVVNKFIDFNRSLADQRTMAEMISCYILSTWFLDAFTVTGFIWPNGEKGSGKTLLLTVVAELSYLGQMILAGGSFAALRDLADYGAFLGFDDAENLSDPRQTDPDKRALLLAGNRKGNTVPLKEPGADGKWKTRYVNTFCPRGFSAIRTPDATLGSRTIVVPLIRTPDRERANADPLDFKLWPHDRQSLINDLWALGLANLASLPDYEQKTNATATLTGRNLEPWRALLSVAMWLDGNGVPGLWERMEQLSVDYQGERQEIESGDLTTLIIRALCHRAISAISAGCAIKGDRWIFKTEEIKAAVIQIAQDSESDLNIEKITGQRVGRILSKMRLTQEPRPGGKGSRLWSLTVQDLGRWGMSYGIDLNQYSALAGTTLADLYFNGTNGTDGTNGTSDADESGITDGNLAEAAAFFDDVVKEPTPEHQPIRDEEGREYNM